MIPGSTLTKITHCQQQEQDAQAELVAGGQIGLDGTFIEHL